MKRHHLFYLLLAITLLNSCTQYNNLFDKMYSSNNDINIQDYTSKKNNLTNKAKSNKNKPAATLDLKYHPKSYEINAKIKLIIPKAYKDSIFFKWQPPESSKCYPSSFMLIKSSVLDTQSVLDRNNMVCKGTWVANIINNKNNKVLSKTSILIS